MQYSYLELIAICIARFGLSLIEARRTTLVDFDIYSTAYRLKTFEKANDMHHQAWLNSQVQSTNKQGKPVYRTFKKFFDYEAEFIRSLRPYEQTKRTVVTLEDSNQRLQDFLKKGGK